MNKLLMTAVLATAAGLVRADVTVVDFNSRGLGPDSYYRPSESDAVYADKPWSDSGVEFDFYDGEYSWSGFTYSTVNNPAVPGFGNQYAVYGDVDGTGMGGGGTYALGAGALNWMDGSYEQIPQYITFGSTVRVDELYLNNTAYTALSMRDGDDFAKKFGGASGDDADWLKLTIEGFSGASSQGMIDFYLADFRDADNSNDYIVEDWTKVELSGLGSNVTSLAFSLSSSDAGAFGMNTPAYFAMDNLTFEAVPEPSSVLLLAGGFGGVLWFRRRRRFFFRG